MPGGFSDESPLLDMHKFSLAGSDHHNLTQNKNQNQQDGAQNGNDVSTTANMTQASGKQNTSKRGQQQL